MGNKFEDYNASQIVPQYTLLEKFNKLIEFLKSNGLSTNVFRILTNYVEGTLAYDLSLVQTEGKTVQTGDMLLFNNSYIAEVDSVASTLVVVKNVTDHGQETAWEVDMKKNVVQNPSGEGAGEGKTEIGNELEVDGDVTLNSDLTVDGETTLNGTATLKDTTVNGALGVTGHTTTNGNVNVGGNLEATGHIEIDGAGAIHGDVNLGEPSGTTQKTDIHGTLQVHNNLIVDSLSKIQDTDGYLLFNSGDIVVRDGNAPSGLTLTYGKWSLSGSHLLLVMAGNVNGDISSYSDWFDIKNLPSYIGSKIYPIGTLDYWIDSKKVNVFASSGIIDETKNISYRLYKISDTRLIVNAKGNFNASDSYFFRLTFDLEIL